MKSIEERFESYIERIPFSECWLWVGTLSNGIYGEFFLGPQDPHGRRRIKAHRYAWERANGRPAPKRMDVCHSCDNPICVRPSHLWIGTRADNMRDMAVKGRAKQKFCHKGHRMTGNNVAIRKNGQRMCRSCARKYHREYYHRVRKAKRGEGHVRIRVEECE